MDESGRVRKAAGIVGAATLVSRILGYVRDMVVAAFFGAGYYSDVFIAAFRVPNLIRRLFAEGSLSMAFIPVFTEYLALRNEKEAFELARSALRFLALFMVLLVLLGVLSAPLIVRGIAFGFAESTGKFELTILLTRIMFPYVICICLVALSMGILNALGHFAAPALAPVLLNVAMIGAVYLVSCFSTDSTIRVIGLAVGVVAGGLLQLLLQVPFLIRNGIYFWRWAPLMHPGLRKIGRLLLPAVFGAGVYQVNVVISTFLASLLAEGSVSYLYFADRLVQFPIGIFAISIGTALLPSLAKQALSDDFEAVSRTFREALALVFHIVLPSMVGLAVLSEPIVALLFRRGAFDMSCVEKTSQALICYCAGLWAIAAVRIVIPVFYSIQDTWTPVKTGFLSMILNTVLGFLWMPVLGHGGLALATSAASILNFGLLMHAFRKRFGPFGGMGLLKSIGRSAFCSVLMGWFVWQGSRWYDLKNCGNSKDLLVGIAGVVFLGISLYAAFSLVLKSPGGASFYNMMFRRGTRE
ncbi:MAG: murein biosynthesis integral membrane protein MurJ [Thermodesulfobacteriota bacterium]